MRSWQAQKSPAQGRAFGFLVAAAGLPGRIAFAASRLSYVGRLKPASE
jgi:hypothetical protein